MKQELSEYSRHKELYVEQITRWKECAIAGTKSCERLTKEERCEWQKDQKKSCQLEKELTQKEKALVEAAALLVPGEKAKATWGDDGEAYNDNGGHYIFSFLEY